MNDRSPTTGWSRERWWLGRDDVAERPRSFRAGGIEFDLSGIDLRRIRLDDLELVNRLYVAIRDVDWNTIPSAVSGLDVRPADDGAVQVTFDARNVGSGIALTWRGAISATSDGRIAYEMNAVVGQGFRYNRIGFCVLHPASAAGSRYHAWTPSGQISGRLPDLIAPQSIVDGLETPLFPAYSRLDIDLDGVTVSTSFEGDLFEMEDQRNWSDGSFKTYGTPISLGYPHEARAGDVIRQRVDISVKAPPTRPNSRGAAARTADAAVTLNLAEATSKRWPELGLGVPTTAADRAIPPAVRPSLAAARVDHVRLDVHLTDPEWQAVLDQGREDAAAIGARLEVALFVEDGSTTPLREVAAALARPDVARVISLDERTAGTATTPAATLRTIVDALRSAGVEAPILTGTNGDFAEINRDRPAPGAWAGVAYALNPQVHSVDEMSLVESLPVHAQTVATARSFAAAGSVVVSPVTLRGRFNPAAAEPALTGREAPPADYRQPSLFAAGWLLGSIASMIDGGADAVTYFETHGPRGVVGSSGNVFPAWFVLADLADRDDREPRQVENGTGPRVAALAMAADGAARVLIANLTTDRQRVRVGRLPGSSARIRALDAGTAPPAVADPTKFGQSFSRLDLVDGFATVELEPYAYIRIEAVARN
jgi:hypothetical protein